MIATLVLDNLDNYVYADGELPNPRPLFDKVFLREICRDKVVSKEAFDILPGSIRKVIYGIEAPGLVPEQPITIREIAKLATLLLVTRVDNEEEGTKFRLDAFVQIADFKGFEIWIRKENK